RNRNRLPDVRPPASGDRLPAGQGNCASGRRRCALHHPSGGEGADQTMQGKEIEIMAHDPENTLILELKTGPVKIALRPDLAPNHVARIKELTRKGFYDGVVFHRVIPGFMAQPGDPTGTGA